jgi:iron complex outermembrane receptor protein
MTTLPLRRFISAPALVLFALGMTATPRSLIGQILPDSLGSVTVRVTHGSLPLDAVTVRSGSATGRTDQSGQAILHLPVGSRTISATRIGFLPESTTVVVRARTDATIALVLTAQARELSEMIVVATTRSGRRIEDEPLRVEVLAKEEVEEKLLMTPGDITMLLNETSGLRVQTISPSIGGANVRVQGLRGRYTQILSDGLPLHGGQTGGLGLLQIPPMDLGGVEIVKGAASALYGSSALGGVINLLSRRPRQEPVREIMINQTVRSGTDLVSFLSSATNEGEIGYTLLAGVHRQSQLDRDGDNWTDMPGYERLVIRPRAFWSGSQESSVMITAGFTGEEREGGTMPARSAPDGTPFPERLRTRRFDAGGVSRFATSADGAISIRGSASLQSHGHRFGPTIENDEHLTWFGEGAYTLTKGGNTWVFGAAVQQERYAAREVPGFDYAYAIPGAFAQTTMDLSPVVSATASGRFDHHSEYGGFFSPRLSLLLRPMREWSVRASIGQGYFAPNPFTEETEVTGLAVLELLHDLVVERATSASLDLGGVVGPMEVNATVFGSIVRDPTGVREAAGDPTRVEIVNVGEATHTGGAELLLRAHPEPFHITANYTFVRSRETDPETGLRRSVPLTPRHQAGLVAMWEREESARAGLEIYYTGKQPLPDDAYRAESKAYVHVGVLAEKRFGPARVFVNAENLLDYRQTKYDPLVRPARGLGGRWTNDVWAPLEGRVANAGVRFDFR